MTAAGESQTTNGLADLQPWEIIDSRQVYDSPPWIRVLMQSVRLPDGTVIDDYRQIELSDFVLMFVQTADSKVIVERQYKHGVRKVSLTLPAGNIEQGEVPIEAAQRELLEETGYQAKDWRLLGTFVTNGSFGCGQGYFYLATGAEQVAQPESGDLEEIEVLLLELDDLQRAMNDGRIVTMGTVAIVGLATMALAASEVPPTRW